MQHLIVALICLIMPIISFLEIRKRRMQYSDVGKERTYFLMHLWYWFMIAAVLYFVPFGELYYPKHDLSINWILHAAAISLIIYELFTSVVPILLIPRSQKLRKSVMEDYDTKRAIYPVTERQQKRFLLVAVSVGIGEEIIFRGFLYNYLQDYFALSSWLSFIVVTLYFAAGHYHQGWNGAVNALKLALIFGYLYFTTGSLLVPIIVHVLYDMKIVWLTRVLETHKSHRVT